MTITAINAGLGLAIGITMWLIGMPNPLLFGVIGFAFNYVPYLGAVSDILIATIVGLVTFDSLSAGLLPGLVFFAFTSIEGQFVSLGDFLCARGSEKEKPDDAGEPGAGS